MTQATNNRIFSSFFLIIYILFLSSCMTPLPRAEFTDFTSHLKAREILNEFRKYSVKQISMNQAVIIRMGFREFTALGMCDYNTTTEEISLALMTTTGIKLIEVASKAGKINRCFTAPGFTKNGSRAERLIENVRNIYFQPKGDFSSYRVLPDRVICTWKDKQGKTELLFGKAPDSEKIFLFEKRLYTANALAATVYYSNYRQINGKDIPMTIAYRSSKYNYSLILKTKKTVKK